jgi:copper chaperone CopZ
MKRKIVFVLAFLLIPVLGLLAQDNSKTFKEIKIKTAFHCSNGKALIEKELIKSEGVKEVLADVETKYVTVKYDEAVTNKDKLVAAIEKIGYLTEFSKEGTQINKACTHGDTKQEDKK